VFNVVRLNDSLRKSWEARFIGLKFDSGGWTSMPVTDRTVSFADPLKFGSGTYLYEMVRLQGSTPFAHAVGTATIKFGTTQQTSG
jgi:hypothetical protein